MFKSYFKVAWRNLRANKVHAIINVIGLSLGIGSSILIFSLVKYHLNFDRFHKDPDRIYRMVTEFHQEGIGYTQGIQAPVAKAFRDEYTFAEKLARVYSSSADILVPGEPSKKFREALAFVEPDYFDIFSFPLIAGNEISGLKEPGTAVITQQVAKKYFGRDNALGKILKVGEKHFFRITGVLKDLPPNTDRRTEIYLSYNSLKDFDTKIENYWTGVYGEYECFILLKKGIKPAEVERLFPAFNKRHFTGSDVKTFVYKFQPLSDIHFNPEYGAVIEKKKLWAPGFIGLFLVATACVNFVNIATAQAINRSREVGIRKVLGGTRAQLFWQFLSETILITVAAVMVAYALACVSLPIMNRLLNAQISINLLHDGALALFILCLSSLIMVAAGSYPALVLSGFKPALALKNKITTRHAGSLSLRKILVVSQFAISQILIVAAIVIASQISYSTGSDLGFAKNGLLLLPLPSDNLAKMTALKMQLQQLPAVSNTSLCFQAPAALADNYTSARFDNRDMDESFTINTKDADEGYVPTFDLKIIAGRNIFHSDSTREFIINEALVRKLGLTSPKEAIGKKLMTSHGKRNGIIVGVMKDFYNSSFHNEIAPICIRSDYKNYNYCAARIGISNPAKTLSTIEKIWNDIYPDAVYSYGFEDDFIAQFYSQDSLLLTLIEFFAGIAILISCLGLYGLISFLAIQKRKEIAVRKVLGAGVERILWLFGKEFTILVAIAFLAACPLAWWAMNDYLQDFKYRIALGVGIFSISIGTTLTIALTTVGFQSIRAAIANPAKSLRSD